MILVSLMFRMRGKALIFYQMHVHTFIHSYMLYV